MSYLFDQLTMIMYGILLVVVFFAVLVTIYIIKSKKKGKAHLDEDSTDYSTFRRKDTSEYVKNIVNIKDNMIITDGGYRFVAVIRCHGFDFYDEDYDVQLQTAQGYMGFVNTINKPISYRQYGKPIDLEDTQIMYQEALNAIDASLFNSQEDLKEIAKTLKTELSTMEEEDKILYTEKIAELEKQINALKFRKFHIQDQMRIIGIFGNGDVNPIPEETYVVDYMYEQLDFSVSLSDEEIYKKAIQELDARVNAKIHALSAAHVKGYRCTTAELIDMCRRYSYPVSAARFKQRDIDKSSFFDDINTSDSLSRMSRLALESAREKNAQEYMDGVVESAEECAQRAIKTLEKVYAEAAEEEARLTSGGRAKKKERSSEVIQNKQLVHSDEHRNTPQPEQTSEIKDKNTDRGMGGIVIEEA